MRFSWRGTLQALAIIASATGLAYLMWELAIPTAFHHNYLQTFLITGDYRTDADTALLLGMQGKLWALYSTHPLPLMLPVALLVRLVFLIPAHWLGLVHGAHHFAAGQSARYDSALDHRYFVGMIGMTVTSLAVLAYSLRQRLRFGTVWAIAIIVAVIVQPVAQQTLIWGHPEEFFGACFLAGGMFCYLHDRWRAGLILAIIAAASKQTFFLALPLFFLCVPVVERRRWWSYGIGLLLLLILPFVAPSIGNFLSQNQSVSTANGVASFYQLDLFHAFGIASISSIAHPLIIFIAIVLPTAIAWRSGWKLNGLQAASLLVIIYLLRCILDPFNIPYYAAAAVLALFPLEYALWQQHRHVLQRWSRLQTTEYWFPVGALLVGLLMGSFNSGFVASLWTSIFGNTDGKDYVLDFLILALLCLPWALNRRWTFDRSRQRLYGGLLLVLIVIIIIAHLRADPSAQHPQLPAPGGFKSESLAQIVESARPNSVYWLGPNPLDGNYLNLHARAKPTLSGRPASQIAYLNYGTYLGVQSIGVFTFYPQGPGGKNIAKEVRKCTGLRPCKNVTVIQTKFGPAIITVNAPIAINGKQESQKNSPINIELANPHADLYIISDAGISAQIILSHLQTVS